MATVSFDPGRSEISIGHRLALNVTPPPASQVPGGLYPMRLMTYELDEYRVMAGWPRAVPKHDVRSQGVVSVIGERVEYRPNPTDVQTGAITRWVADADSYDPTALAWFPTATSAHMVWRTAVNYAPVLVPYEYRVGVERFYATALNFDSDTLNHMWLDAAGVLPNIGYTVIMVMSPNSTFGNNVAVPFNGLWCPGGPTPAPAGDGTFAETATNFYSVTLQGYYIYLQTEQRARTKGVSVATALSGNTPLYLVLSLSKPTTALYAAYGPSSIRKVSVPAGDQVNPTDAGVVLGRSTGDVNHTADMALLDLGIYPDVLTDSQVRTEITLLSQIYGDAL